MLWILEEFVFGNWKGLCFGGRGGGVGFVYYKGMERLCA